MSTAPGPATAPSATAPSSSAPSATAAGRGRRRALPWIALVLLLAVAGVVVAALSGGSASRPLDPTSHRPEASLALSRVLAGYGARLDPTSSLAQARSDHDAVVAVLDPNAYSGAQLRELTASVRRVVLLEPGLTALRAVSSLEPDTSDSAAVSATPDCTLPAAVAAGPLSAPDSAELFTGAPTRCYGGLVAVDGPVVAVGSAGLFRNDHLGRAGVAALDVNLLTADRTATTVRWLRPGSDAAGSGGTSVWDLFPPWAHRAFVWLLVVGGVLLLWRGRRLGPAVSEPLPVIVRAAELTEGHGRLYRRAGAADRAAAALRAATARRLAPRAGVPATATPQQVALALTPLVGRDPRQVFAVLAGPAPADDAGLVALADDLAELEDAARRTTLHATVPSPTVPSSTVGREEPHP